MNTQGKLIALLFLLALGACLAASPSLSRADTASDLQAQIDSQNAAISALDKEIAGYQDQLTAIGANKNTLTNAIKTLTVTANNLKANIALTQKKITANNLQIQSLGDSIVKTQASMEDLQAAVAKSIRDENEQETNTLGDIIATQSNFADIWQQASQEATFRDDLHDKVVQLASTKTALESTQAQVQTAKSSLVSLASQLQDQNAIAQKNVSDKATLLAQTKNQEAAYQKLVTDKTALKNQMESDERDYESKLKFILNPNSLPPMGSSPLAWPLDKIVITQLFGKTVDSARLYVTGTHNGVDFAANVGTPAKAMASGVVIGEGNSDLACKGASYGNWIFIKYDNGLSAVFGHLSLIKAPVGERVTTGDIVAYTGKTGYATGPHLHVSVWPSDGVHITSFPSQACPGRTITIPTAAANAYLDPMLYFPKK